ncbi:DUF916 domain-containing protein [Candidatus Peregrinibacteria bacterium]|nr:DUF916 domain-containing protein [Candidatus Peregrinibacteria bacterium]
MKKYSIILLAAIIPIALSSAHASSNDPVGKQNEDGQQAEINITQENLEAKFSNSMEGSSIEMANGTQQIGSQEVRKNEGFTMIPLYPNTVNPRKFLFEIKPGEQGTEEAYIKNFSDEPVTVLLYGADPTVSNTGTLAYKTRQNPADGPGTWIKFDEPKVDLGPLEGKKVRFTVNVPKDTAYGDYKAGIAIEKTKQDINNASITIATRVIIHAEIKVTSNPLPIPKGESAVKETVPAWKQYYFWGSLLLFLGSVGLLGWVTLKDRKSGSKKKIHTSRKKK